MTKQQLKRLFLDPHKIGLMRLNEIGVSSSRFTGKDIVHIGKCSINRKYIIVGKVGNEWVVVNYAREKVRDFRGHGYIIKGKKVIALQRNRRGSLEELMSAYECVDRSKSLDRMTADEMFREGMGKRTYKKPGSGGSFRVNPPLRGMGLNRGDMERNRPDFIDYCKYLYKNK